MENYPAIRGDCKDDDMKRFKMHLLIHLPGETFIIVVTSGFSWTEYEKVIFLELVI